MAAILCTAILGLAFVSPRNAHAYTPESPEVVALIDKGLKYLETTSHTEVGGQCLIALAFLKRGMPADHPKIEEAVEWCRRSVNDEQQRSYIYGKCIAIIFLTELDAVKHRDLINSYLSQLKDHQKEHGGFSYKGVPTGDTSQTQYAALAYWELLNHGISPDADSVQRCLNWVMRTRDPSGVWGYQGIDPGNFTLIEQPDKPGVSMAAAGMSGTLILGNLVGILKPPQEANLTAAGDELPDALKRVETSKVARAPTLPRGNVEPQRVTECVAAGAAWFDKNFTFEVHEYQSYYLYSIERFRSFQEYLDGTVTEEPEWYNHGVEMLKKSQQANGSWNDNAGEACATAFSVLFLLRSTQKSIEASLGEGTLVGGRGLPRDLSKMKLRGGKLIVEHKPTEADQLMGMLEDSNSAALDELLDNPAALNVDNVTAADARRLQQVVKSGSAGARVMAVRALSRLRDVEYAPTLIFALTDPDKRVVREARDGLKSVSRRFEGYGPSDNFEDAERRASVERWKEWYRTVRPDAPPLP
ncbi:hypothetical protein [Lacipirellula sp.]|uniref:hypothetical protein n=1 Tax=Lacipirellula sp. TaxID=2691419 RepID=UPI003D109EEF